MIVQLIFYQMQEPFLNQNNNIPAHQISMSPYIDDNGQFPPQGQLNNNPYNVPNPPPPYLQPNPFNSPLPQAINPYNQAKPNNYSQYDEFADKLNKLKQKKKSIHGQTLTATIFLIAGITTGFVLFFATDVGLSQGGFIGIQCGSYALYLLIACCCNKLTEYLTNIDRGQNFQTYYNQVREMKGRFIFHAQCYHYEIRHHTRHYKDAEGKERVEHYTTREKVVTHTATQFLNPYQTKDQSGQIDRIRSNTNIVFIHFFVKYRFFDTTSSNNFQHAYSSFKSRNTRDQYQDFSMRYDVPGLIERKAFYVGSLDCQFKTWFYLFALFGLAWPYSLWVQGKITRFDVETMKVLKV